MHAKGKYSALQLLDEEVAKIFEAAAIPMDEEGREIAEDLRAVVIGIRFLLENRSDIDQMQTTAKTLRRAAKVLQAAPRFIETAFEDAAVTWMIESDLVMRVPEQWLPLGVLRDGVFTNTKRRGQ